MKEVCALSIDMKKAETSSKFEILLEAARRANWDALHGPVHLRSGRYWPERDVRQDQAASERSGSRIGSEADNGGRASQE
jgi:hypothetical protein